MGSLNSTKLQALGCDSIYAPGRQEPGADQSLEYCVNSSEYAVYSPSQVRLCFFHTAYRCTGPALLQATAWSSVVMNGASPGHILLHTYTPPG
jgi:hypothetical protein